MQGIITTVNFYSGTIHPENVLFRYNMSIPAQKQELNWIALLRTKTLTSLLCLNTFDAQVKVNIQHTQKMVWSQLIGVKNGKGCISNPTKVSWKGISFFSVHWKGMWPSPHTLTTTTGSPSLSALVPVTHPCDDLGSRSPSPRTFGPHPRHFSL
jgi:hypothetical protein